MGYITCVPVCTSISNKAASGQMRASLIGKVHVSGYLAQALQATGSLTQTKGQQLMLKCTVVVL